MAEAPQLVHSAYMPGSAYDLKKAIVSLCPLVKPLVSSCFICQGTTHKEAGHLDASQICASWQIGPAPYKTHDIMLQI